MTTTAFNSAGTTLWTLPSNIDINTPLTVILEGADGGDWDFGGGEVGFGGAGGRVTGTIALTGMTPGVTQLQINVGGKGLTITNATAHGGLQAGGYNGGGQGGGSTNGQRGAPGGGGTDIRVSPFALANRLAVAGGGGGQGGDDLWNPPDSAGGKGGALTGGTGTDGAHVAGYGRGGAGGTQAAGGAAGLPAGSASNNATAGSLGQGGSGSSHSSSGFNAGGGGGGGYYGGGGGAGADSTSGEPGGGGGGSNYVGGLTTSTSNLQGTRSSWVGPGYVSLAYNLAPNQPALVAHANGDDTAGVTVAWAFSDSDPGDTQSKADVQWRVGSGAWTTIANAVTTAQQYQFAANTFAAVLGQSVEWQVRTYDAAGAQGPWSTSAFFTPRTESAVVPTLTLASISSTTPTVTVAVPSGTFRYFKVTVTDTVTTTVTDYGWQDAGSAVTTVNYTLPAYAYVLGRNYTFKTQVSTYTDVPVPGPNSAGTTLAGAVNAPLTPVIASCVPNPLTASVTLTITNPGSDPNPPVANRVYRQDLTNNTAEQRIAITVPVNGTFTDWQPALNINYRYRVEAVSAAGVPTSSA